MSLTITYLCEVSGIMYMSWEIDVKPYEIKRADLGVIYAVLLVNPNNFESKRIGHLNWGQTLTKVYDRLNHKSLISTLLCVEPWINSTDNVRKEKILML